MATTTISFTFDAEMATNLTTALCAIYGYQGTIPDPNNIGQTIATWRTPAAFAQQCVVQFCKNALTSYQAQQAAELARQQAIASITAAINASQVTVTQS